MRITNNHKTDLGLPNGQVLRSGEPTPVRGWDQIKDNAVVSAWVKRGILTLDGGDAENTSSADKDELIARLAEFGVKADKRKTVEKLQAMLAEAQAEADKAKGQQEILFGSDLLPAEVEIADGQTVQLGDVVRRAYVDSGLSVEDWNALPSEIREAKLADAVEAMKSEAQA